MEAIARAVGGTVEGDASLTISGVEQIESAEPGHLTFIGGATYIPLWRTSRATAALVSQELAVEPGAGRALVRVKSADLAMARVLELFEPAAPCPATGVHPAATVDATASIGEGVTIGPGCFVGAGAHIGAGTKLYPNVTVLDGTRIGAKCILWPGVVIRERCTIGNGVILHPQVSIGADGFGYRPSPDGRGLVKIPHIGTVVLGDGVEIGANSCVDRGKFSATSIGAGTKIDNLVQIGRCCVIAACTGVAGSVTMGDGVMVGGCVAIRDHLTIGSGARISGGSGVMADVPAGQTVAGAPATDSRQALRQFAALRKLPDLLRNQRKESPPC